MSLTCGFYNAIDHDRLYDASDFSAIFDGIIRDGVFMSVGDCLMVKESTGMTVTVGTGRAWFNSTWTMNDALLKIYLDEAELVLSRIDAIVLEVNAKSSVRKNSIKVIKGTPSSTPERPELESDTDLWQYPLAYIMVGPEVTEIHQADIENMVGQEPCPFVTGILDTVDTTALIVQWEAQWNDYIVTKQRDFAAWSARMQKDYETWTSNHKAVYDAWIEESEQAYQTWYAETVAFVSEEERKFLEWTLEQRQKYSDWSEARKDEFNEWFKGVKDTLDEDTAGKLYNMIVGKVSGEGLGLSYEDGHIFLTVKP